MLYRLKLHSYHSLSSAWCPPARTIGQQCPPHPAPPPAGCQAHTAPGQPPVPTGRPRAQWSKSWGGSARQQTGLPAGDKNNIKEKKECSYLKFKTLSPSRLMLLKSINSWQVNMNAKSQVTKVTYCLQKTIIFNHTCSLPYVEEQHITFFLSF